MNVLHHPVVAHTTQPTIVFACDVDGVDPHTVVDLRSHDMPVSDVDLRIRVRAAWQMSPLLVLRVDGQPTARVLALLHGVVRRALRHSASVVQQFDARHRVVALTDAAAPASALLQLFAVRVRASTSQSNSPRAATPIVGSSHAR